MLSENDNGRPFEQLLEQDLLPVLQGYLIAHPHRQLVWLMQTPTLDNHVSLPREIDQYQEVHFDNIRRYNEFTRRILKYIMFNTSKSIVKIQKLKTIVKTIIAIDIFKFRRIKSKDHGCI